MEIINKTPFIGRKVGKIYGKSTCVDLNIKNIMRNCIFAQDVSLYT